MCFCLIGLLLIFYTVLVLNSKSLLIGVSGLFMKCPKCGSRKVWRYCYLLISGTKVNPGCLVILFLLGVFFMAMIE